MGETDHGVFQTAFFVVLVVLTMLPLLAMLWRSTGLRAWLWQREQTRCVLCCDRYLGDPAAAVDAHDLRTIRELEEARRVAAQHTPQPRTVRFTRLGYQYRRAPRMALRLATWREDVRSYSARDVFTMKLQQVQQHHAPPGTTHDTMDDDDYVAQRRATLLMDADLPITLRDVRYQAERDAVDAEDVPYQLHQPRDDQDEEHKQEEPERIDVVTRV